MAAAYSNVSFNFKGKRALVTGGARGIGRGIALALAQAGAETFVLDVNKEGLDTLAKEHKSIHTVVVDLKDWEATRKAVEGILPIDLVVNDAGIATHDLTVDIKPHDLDQVLTVNTKAALNVCQVVAKDLIAKDKPGSIVNVSSQASKVPLIGFATYNISKAALNMITKSMASELGKHKIRVNSVLPTITVTEMSKPLREPEAVANQFLSRIPLGRFAEISEIVGPVLFLLSDCASMVHGHQLRADGGFTVS